MRKDTIVGWAMIVVSALEIAVAVAAGLRRESEAAVDTRLFGGALLAALGMLFVARGRRRS